MKRKIDLGELFEKNYGSLYLVVFHYLKNTHDAYDIVMNIFAKLIEKANNGDFNDKAHAKYFLYTAVKHAVVDHLRVLRKNNGLMHLDSVEIEDKSNSDIAEQEISHVELIVEIIQMIEGFPKRRKEIIKLHLFEGRTLEEISIELKISLRTVRNIYYKAKRILREKFGNNGLFND